MQERPPAGGQFDYPRFRNPLDTTPAYQGIHDGSSQRSAQVGAPFSPVQARKGHGLAEPGRRYYYSPFSQGSGAPVRRGIVNAAGTGRARHNLHPAARQHDIHQLDTGDAGKVTVARAGLAKGCVSSHLAGCLRAARVIKHQNGAALGEAFATSYAFGRPELRFREAQGSSGLRQLLILRLA